MGVPGFAVHFIVQSVIAGTMVARLALRRDLDFTPGFVSFHTTLPAGAPLGLFTSIANLMPGTVCVSVCTQTVTVHVLDTRSPYEPGLRQLEQKVSALFGLD